MAIDPSIITLDDLEYGDLSDPSNRLFNQTIENQPDDTDVVEETNTADSQNSNRQAFKAEVELAYIKNDESITIESDRIQNIVISHDYEIRSMPIIVISLNIDSDLYTDLVQNRNNAKIYLCVRYLDAHSDTSLSKDYIEGQFSYFLSSTSPNYSKTLDESNTNADSNYKNIYIGLMDMRAIDELRCSFDGVFKKIDQNTLLYMAIKDTKIVMQQPSYNATYDAIIIPPMISRARFIKYIFDTDPFYDTDYLYFIDFETAYLLSRDGTSVSANDGTLDNVIIDVRDVTTEEAYYDGMEIKDGAYYIYINPANTNVAINQGTEKVANTLIAMDEDGSQKVELNINRSVGSGEKITYQRTDNPLLYKNAVESSALTIEMVKENIDSRYITPNKKFMVKNYEEYQDYNGDYLLMYKHEIINGKAGEFTVSVAMGLKKLGNIESIGNSVLGSGYKKSITSSTQAYTSTARKKTYASKKATTSS